MRRLGWACMLASALVAVAVSGCATVAQRLDDAYAPSATLYVAPFVDFTGQRGGVDLMVALQNHIYRAAPQRFSYVFDEAALCIDGTVHSVDVRAEADALRVTVEVSAVLLRHDGTVVRDLGTVLRERVFRALPSRGQNNERQRRVLRVLWQDVAEELLNRLAQP